MNSQQTLFLYSSRPSCISLSSSVLFLAHFPMTAVTVDVNTVDIIYGLYFIVVVWCVKWWILGKMLLKFCCMFKLILLLCSILTVK